MAWLRSHLNIYADDYQVGGTFYLTNDLQMLLQAFGILLDTLRECECFTDHTLAHPLNCRGGVVARLSA